METLVVKSSDKKGIKKASGLIKKGEVVAFPTETVYGLGADALNRKAVLKIFKAKKRPADNPLIVHIANEKQLGLLVEYIPESAYKLIKKFWPGPLTIILKKKKKVPSVTTGGLNTVAVRMPSNETALELIKKSNPLAAPSANLSGKASPTTAKHVYEDMKGRIPLIIDGGKTKIGIESTVVDLSSKKPVLLRPGKITAEQLIKILGSLEIPASVYGKKVSKAMAPGMKYRHYSPDAKVILVYGKKSKAKIRTLVKNYKKEKLKTAVIGFEYYSADYNCICVTEKDMTKKLFSKFRDFDLKKTDIIIVEGVDEIGLGLGLMNRLKKASTEIIKT
ncbi:MAG: L-threonylcarbamoyladenylate synthase [Candidatus Nanoarchaeia archaeon]|nr:L-threonylcarbamoyladenylate synthase [Candidatus Nanoarchaeia archaeon]